MQHQSRHVLTASFPTAPQLRSNTWFPSCRSVASAGPGVAAASTSTAAPREAAARCRSGAAAGAGVAVWSGACKKGGWKTVCRCKAAGRWCRRSCRCCRRRRQSAWQAAPPTSSLPPALPLLGAHLVWRRASLHRRRGCRKHPGGLHPDRAPLLAMRTSAPKPSSNDQARSVAGSRRAAAALLRCAALLRRPCGRAPAFRLWQCVAMDASGMNFK